MTDQELLELNARVIEKNRVFEGILSNPDFIEWQKAGPLQAMREISNAIVTIDRSIPDWKEKVAEMVISYQAVSRVVMGTAIGAEQSRGARSAMKELEKR